MLPPLALADGAVMSCLINTGKNEPNPKTSLCFVFFFLQGELNALFTRPGMDEGSDQAVRSGRRRKRREKGKWVQAVRSSPDTTPYARTLSVSLLPYWFRPRCCNPFLQTFSIR